MGETGRLAVFHGTGKPFEIREYPVPEPEPGAILIRIALANVCGSDMHYWRGEQNYEKMGRPLEAAMLLGQQLYRKIFKKGEPTQTNSVFDRLDVDVGTVDPRTGQQQATARFKINDQFMFVGDIGVGGDYRGMLKYLIRFR